MAEVVTLAGPRRVAVVREPERALAPQEVRVRTLYSGISAGTELSAYRGSSPHLGKRWDADMRLFATPGAAQPYPLASWGYEEVGEIAEVGEAVRELAPGELVYGAWGHRSEAVLEAAYARERRLPEGLDPLLGIFSHIGAVALNGVHDAAIRLGDWVTVFGLGVPGQIVARLARAAGARVIGVELLPKRLELARASGVLAAAFDASEGSVAERVKALTGRGADVSIEVTGASRALHEAIRATAYSARVVALGFFQGEAQGLYLGEEFHHNRIQLVASQISGVAPEASYRWSRLRLAQTVMRLQAEGALELEPLISRIYPYQAAAEAFAQLDARPQDALQLVLDFRHAQQG